MPLQARLTHRVINSQLEWAAWSGEPPSRIISTWHNNRVSLSSVYALAPLINIKATLSRHRQKCQAAHAETSLSLSASIMIYRELHLSSAHPLHDNYRPFKNRYALLDEAWWLQFIHHFTSWRNNTFEIWRGIGLFHIMARRSISARPWPENFYRFIEWVSSGRRSNIVVVATSSRRRQYSFSSGIISNNLGATPEIAGFSAVTNAARGYNHDAVNINTCKPHALVALALAR